VLNHRFSPLTGIVFVILSLVPSAATGVTYKVLHSFNRTKGDLPASGVIFDTSGNLYGTTNSGGAFDGGTVFQLVPDGNGNWTEHVLYSFCASANCSDGGEPVGGLVFDSAGNLYGTTVRGGSQDSGVVFQLTPGAGGKWTENVLYNFCTLQNCADGSYPIATLILDASGNLYGTTTGGGTKSDGTAFELSPAANGTWNEKVLHSFCSSVGCADGNGPYGNLISDSFGNLYGTTIEGGVYSKNCPYACGIVFELTPGKNGKWTEQVIHSFRFSDGAVPFFGLIFDNSGNLYGDAEVGGAHEGGVVFELSPGAKSLWTETVLHSFYAREASPYSNLAFDQKGNLYGTTLEAGHYMDGILFKLSPNSSGAWTETVLHSFNFEHGGEGSSGVSGVTVDSSGNLYGTTAVGGKNNEGVIYEITP
jgi:uncharacterized repeat protein (TIGR03803 family)